MFTVSNLEVPFVTEYCLGLVERDLVLLQVRRRFRRMPFELKLSGLISVGGILPLTHCPPLPNPT